MAGDPPHSSQFHNKVVSEFEENLEVNLATISASNLELSFLVLGAHSFHSALFGVPSKSRDGFVDGFPAENQVILHENNAILHKIRNEFHGWATGKKMKMIIRSLSPLSFKLFLSVFSYIFSRSSVAFWLLKGEERTFSHPFGEQQCLCWCCDSSVPIIFNQLRLKCVFHDSRFIFNGGCYFIISQHHLDAYFLPLLAFFTE